MGKAVGVGSPAFYPETTYSHEAMLRGSDLGRSPFHASSSPIHPAAESLSPELYAVVQAMFLDGLTSREAARLLGLPQGTVKTRIARARSQLRVDLIGVVP